MAYIAKDKEINLLFTESEKMHRKLIETVGDGIFMADVNDVLFFVNKAFVDLHGYINKDEVLGKNMGKDLFYDEAERIKLSKEMKKTGFVRDYEMKTVKSDGTAIVLSTTCNYIRNESDKVIGIEGIIHDVTAHKLLEKKVKEEREKLQEILTFDEKVTSIRNLDKLVEYIVNKTMSILNADKCSLMLVDDITNELCIKYAKGLDEDIVRNARVKLGDSISGIVAKERGQILVTNIEYDEKFERKSRPSYSGRSFMSVAMKSKEKLLGVINVADKNSKRCDPFNEEDLKILSTLVRQAAIAIENANLYKELNHLAVTDPLTSLNNYRYFVKCLDDEIQRLKRFPESLSLLMIDIDDFKTYNDTFGHLEGDLFLKEFGELLKSNLRTIDKVCRYGGDEFVILLPETNSDQAKIVAEKIREKVESAVFKQSVSISIGIAEYKKSMSRFEFTKKADKAMYQAKQSGKNQVIIFA